ncbi:MAG: hypothetical protein DRN15_03890 [Thermoprotei archaeon]|nr:MAG: hypothetical protein DRN15_03890 [Thermoprotei archaeon]
MKRKYRILAACALGGSISFFTQRLIEAARKRGIELEIDIMTIDQVHHADLSSYDLILVAPQVQFHIDAIKERAKNVPIVPIDRLTYALADGEGALEKLVLPVLKKE